MILFFCPKVEQVTFLKLKQRAARGPTSGLVVASKLCIFPVF
jgi:hypothetical protein